LSDLAGADPYREPVFELGGVTFWVCRESAESPSRARVAGVGGRERDLHECAAAVSGRRARSCAVGDGHGSAVGGARLQLQRVARGGRYGGGPGGGGVPVGVAGERDT